MNHLAIPPTTSTYSIRCRDWWSIVEYSEYQAGGDALGSTQEVGRHGVVKRWNSAEYIYNC